MENQQNRQRKAYIFGIERQLLKKGTKNFEKKIEIWAEIGYYVNVQNHEERNVLMNGRWNWHV